MNKWTVYILRCRCNSLYTGVTTDLDRRLIEHNTGLGAKYTRANRPCRLVWAQSGFTESGAKKEEARIKKMNKVDKEKLVTTK